MNNDDTPRIIEKDKYTVAHIDEILASTSIAGGDQWIREVLTVLRTRTEELDQVRRELEVYESAAAANTEVT